MQATVKRHRGRPRKAPEDQPSRAALIRAGLVHLTERGYSSVGVDDIVAAAGVTKGSFYHHFKSKAEFGAVLIDAYGAYFRDRLIKCLTREGLSASERLRAFTEDAEAGMARHQFTRGCLVGNLGQEMASLPEPYRAQLVGVLREWQTITAQCLRDGQQNGEIGAQHDPDTLAAVFWTSWEGAVLRARLERHPEPLRQVAAAFLQLASQ